MDWEMDWLLGKLSDKKDMLDLDKARLEDELKERDEELNW